MSGIVIDRVSKSYDHGTPVVAELILEIRDGEFMVLVGPSGCGKTTMLRMIAGLEEIDAGTLRIGERVVNDLLPRERDIAMVFQNYALFPHMSVFGNMAFGLQLSKLPKDEIRRRVEEAAHVLDLDGLLDRKPRQLSGGQRQRVAMGRAIVRRPQAFLLDEPLSNLDAKLRVHMRAEIAKLQRRLGVTTVYVTHDQVEAMTMGDRVAVMRHGRLQQVADPVALFDHPVNLFVAGFIGSPAMNLIHARLREAGEGLEVSFANHTLTVPPEVVRNRSAISSYAGKELIVGIRPQAFEDAALHTDTTNPRMEVTVTFAEALGTDTLIRFDLDAPAVLTDEVRELAASVGTEALDRLESAAEQGTTEFVARVDPRSAIRPGDSAQLTVDPNQLHFFDGASGTALYDGPARHGSADEQQSVPAPDPRSAH